MDPAILQRQKITKSGFMWLKVNGMRSVPMLIFTVCYTINSVEVSKNRQKI